jgi:hypothetical protein
MGERTQGRDLPAYRDQRPTTLGEGNVGTSRRAVLPLSRAHLLLRPRAGDVPQPYDWRGRVTIRIVG